MHYELSGEAHASITQIRTILIVREVGPSSDEGHNQFVAIIANEWYYAPQVSVHRSIKHR